jgi:acyl-CoA hydrolase
VTDFQNPIPAKELTMTVLMTPDKANFSGNVHGGALLKMLDEVAYACASRYSGRYVVTVSVDQVEFRQPIHVGDLVTFLAAVNYTGRSSMEIGIKVVTEDVKTRRSQHAVTCYFTMVAKSGRNSVAVPAFVPESGVERRRNAEAKLRRELRADIRRRLEQIKEEVEY